jgi:hypothetical protein
LWAEVDKAAAVAPETTIPALASRTASVNLSASCRPSELFASRSTFYLSFCGWSTSLSLQVMTRREGR